MKPNHLLLLLALVIGSVILVIIFRDKFSHNNPNIKNDPMYNKANFEEVIKDVDIDNDNDNNVNANTNFNNSSTRPMPEKPRRKNAPNKKLTFGVEQVARFNEDEILDCKIYKVKSNDAILNLKDPRYSNAFKKTF